MSFIRIFTHIRVGKWYGIHHSLPKYIGQLRDEDMDHKQSTATESPVDTWIATYWSSHWLVSGHICVEFLVSVHQGKYWPRMISWCHGNGYYKVVSVVSHEKAACLTWCFVYLYLYALNPARENTRFQMLIINKKSKGKIRRKNYIGISRVSNYASFIDIWNYGQQIR